MKTKNIKIVFTTALFIIFIQFKVNAQNLEKYYAAFIYQFTNYIEWPQKSDDFVIGIVGNSSILPHLQVMAREKKVGDSSVAIREWKSVDEIGQCNILYVPESQKDNLPAILNKVGDKQTLIVTESPGLAKNGAHISFIRVEGKIKFDLNKTSITKMGLVVLSALERFAFNVY